MIITPFFIGFHSTKNDTFMVYCDDKVLGDTEKLKCLDAILLMENLILRLIPFINAIPIECVWVNFASRFTFILH